MSGQSSRIRVAAQPEYEAELALVGLRGAMDPSGDLDEVMPAELLEREVRVALALARGAFPQPCAGPAERAHAHELRARCPARSSRRAEASSGA